MTQPAVRLEPEQARIVAVSPPAAQSSSIANPVPPAAKPSPVATAVVPPILAPEPPQASTAAPALAPTLPAGSAAVAPPGTPPVAPPDVWTAEEMAAGLRQCVQLLAPASADVAMEPPMKHGQCGSPAPLALRSAGGKDKVEFSPAPTMNCRLAASMGEWVDKVLQPAAQEALGSRIVKIVGSGSYSCRNIYNNPKLTLSEHATGNAIDVAAFVTADGRTITVAKGWGATERDIIAGKKKAADKLLAAKGSAAKPKANEATPSIEDAGKKAEAKQKGRVQKIGLKPDEKDPKPAKDATGSVDVQPATTKEAAFLKRVHGSSCALFATVLGPEANEAHRDHFHLDMKVRKSSHSVCH